MKKTSLNSFIIFTAAFLLNACSGVEYLDRRTFSEVKTDNGSSFNQYYTDSRTRKYGGLIIKRKGEKLNNADEKEDENMYITLNRNKSKIFAEAAIYNSENIEKTYLDQTALDFGVDRSKKALSLNLTFRY